MRYQSLHTILTAVSALLAAIGSCQFVKFCYLEDLSCTHGGPFSMTLSGLSDNITVPWGTTLTTIFPMKKGIKPVPRTIPISINNGLSSSSQNLNSPSVWSTIDADVSGDYTTMYPILNENGTSIVLGPTWGPYPALNHTTTASIPTVPFGLNLGRYGEWDGGLIIGDFFDAGRVVAPAFIGVPGANDFLSGGRFTVDHILYNQSTASAPTANETITFDLNNDFILLPKTFDCRAGLNVHFENGGFAIVISAALIRSRCQNTFAGPATLGRPFFQAAYTLVGKNNNVYFAQAHNRPSSIMPTPFTAASNAADNWYGTTLTPYPTVTQSAWNPFSWWPSPAPSKSTTTTTKNGDNSSGLSSTVVTTNPLHSPLTTIGDGSTTSTTWITAAPTVGKDSATTTTAAHTAKSGSARPSGGMWLSLTGLFFVWVWLLR
jgi:hypothetical protein